MGCLSKMLDPNVEAVRQKLKERAEVGMRKYGVDTTRQDLMPIHWLKHAQEEALDLAVYLQRIITDLETTLSLPDDDEQDLAAPARHLSSKP